MGLYSKKPVVIAASQWFKHGDHSAVLPYGASTIDQHPIYAECGIIKTLEDALGKFHHVIPGDWIITGVEGEHYACKDAIFKLTYDPF